MRTGNVRRMRRQVRGPASTFVLLALVVLGSSWPAAAQERAPAATTAGSMGSIGNTEVVSYLYLPLALRAYDPGVLIDEGFEGGAVPPPGWQLLSTDPVFTWRAWPFTPPYPPPTYPSAYEGSFSAACDTVGDPQDEVLLSPPILSATAHLQFYSFGSTQFWVSYHLYVWLVLGEWDYGMPVDDIFVRDAALDWPEGQDYVWSLSSVDLTPHLPPGTPVRIAFQYKAGADGDLLGLDSVLITQQ